MQIPDHPHTTTAIITRLTGQGTTLFTWLVTDDRSLACNGNHHEGDDPVIDLARQYYDQGRLLRGHDDPKGYNRLWSALVFLLSRQGRTVPPSGDMRRNERSA